MTVAGKAKTNSTQFLNKKVKALMDTKAELRVLREEHKRISDDLVDHLVARYGVGVKVAFMAAGYTLWVLKVAGGLVGGHDRKSHTILKFRETKP